MSFVPASSKCQEVENRKAQMELDSLSKDSYQVYPIFVASCRKKIGNRRQHKSFPTGDGRKRKKMTRKEHKDASHDLRKLQTSKKKQTVEEEANHESVPKCRQLWKESQKLVRTTGQGRESIRITWT
jgi:hypothetical protein